MKAQIRTNNWVARVLSLARTPDLLALLIYLFVALVLFAAIAGTVGNARAQTKVSQAQINWTLSLQTSTPPTSPAVLLFLPTGKIGYATLDAGLVYDADTNTIRAVTPAQPLPKVTVTVPRSIYSVATFPLTRPGGTPTPLAWPLPPSCFPIGIHRNGIYQSLAGESTGVVGDYNLTTDGTSVVWKPGSLPDPGDVVTAQCGSVIQMDTKYQAVVEAGSK